MRRVLRVTRYGASTTSNVDEVDVAVDFAELSKGLGDFVTEWVERAEKEGFPGRGLQTLNGVMRAVLGR